MDRRSGSRPGSVRRSGTRASAPRAGSSRQGGGGAGAARTPAGSVASRPATTRRPPRRGAVGTARTRIVVGRLVLVLALLAAGVKLIQVQGLQAQELSELAARQRGGEQVLPAERGSITDRNGSPLAFSSEGRALYAQPGRITREQQSVGRDPDAHKEAMARRVAEVLGAEVDERAILDLLRSDKTTVLLAPLVEPAQARAIRADFPEISAEYREVRQYPGGDLAANIIGVANWRADERVVRGLVGLESSADAQLAGLNGSRYVDTAEGDDTIIPGSERAVRPPVPGSDIELTIDSDVQFTVQQMLARYAREHNTQVGSAVVMDVTTGEVYALANVQTFDPNNLAAATPEQLANPAVQTPFEPGSVGKLVTAAAAIEMGLVTPETVLSVPGTIKISDVTVKDAWVHGTDDMTFTGVLARSSNVGTLMTAQRVGEDRFMQTLQDLGFGQRTGVGLPGESAGRVPPREQWSGSTFANLPIGQGLSMTVLQMAGMYQALANDGVRIPPRIIAAEIRPDGTRVATPRPEGVRAMSEQTAQTVRDMLRATMQNAPGQQGSGMPAALEGYQVSGKTGTAQQVDPDCRCYSDFDYWITFAGILPADSPRFVVGVMLDKPNTETAAPLFHDIASYLAQRYQIPLSSAPSPVETLNVG